jgi:hypothetical protein
MIQKSLISCELPALVKAFTLLFLLLAFWCASSTLSSGATSGCDGAGNCYIYASASGSGTGANWTNAYKGFGTGAGKVNPATTSRGVTYWIANGSYGAVNFSTPDSGTSAINIEGATSASHGPASDWSSSLAGQALFAGIGITTDYWTFNGQSRGKDWQSGYTIKSWNQSAAQGAAVVLGTGSSGVSNVNFQYVELEGTGAGFPNNNSTSDKCNVNNCGVWADYGLYENQPVSNLYIGHSFVHHTGNTQFQMNATGPGGSINQNVTWEYNYVSYNHTGQNGQHDEAYSLLASNVVIRNNVFQDISGTGIICDASANSPAMSNWYVYGNLFFNDAAYLALGQNYWLNTVDNGIVALGDGNGNPENLSGTFLFSNNTIANFNFPGVAGANVYSTLPISGVPGGITGNANVVIENNLWYASAFVYGNYNPICNQLNGTCTEDYNASYQGDSAIANVNWQTQQNPASHDYNVSGTTSPFSASQPAATMGGYELATPDPFASHAGVTLGSPYNVDALGVVRGSNGIWDRGALQSGGTTTAGSPVSTSTTLTPSATKVTQGSSVSFTAKVTSSTGTGLPTGTVVFRNGSATLGSVALNASGVAAYSTTSLPVGAATITAVYAGSSIDSSSTSPAVSVTVAAGTLISTTTKLTASATSIKQGASVSFTATVAASKGTAVPAGTVVFHNSSTTLGSVTLNSSGVAVYSTTSLTPGTDSITASYGGSSTDSSSTSPAVAVTVAGASLIVTTTTLKASSTSVPVGTPVTFRATVVHLSGSAVPTGTVTFYNGSAALGSSSINTSGVATYAGSSASAGTFTITARYSGSSTYAASTSPAVVVTIGSSKLVSITKLKSSATTVSKGAAVTLTETVAHSSGSAVPTGTVTFYSGSTALGNSALNSSAVATFSASSASTGTFTITARYGGNSTYAASTSSAIVVTVK